MRHAVRIQPYLARDLFQKLRAYAAARSLTVSAVISAALAEYLERDEVEDALIVRRLDDVTHTLGKLTRDVDALAVGLGSFAWYSFLRAPAATEDKVVSRAKAEYAEFLKQVARQLREGIRFTEQVFPTPRRSAAMVAGTETGGREKEGRS
jgi:predicted transcriptional regulator